MIRGIERDVPTSVREDREGEHPAGVDLSSDAGTGAREAVALRVSLTDQCVHRKRRAPRVDGCRDHLARSYVEDGHGERARPGGTWDVDDPIVARRGRDGEDVGHRAV